MLGRMDARSRSMTFRASDWQEVIAAVPNKECTSYAESFRQKAVEAANAGSDRSRRVFRLLEQICAFGFEPREISDPFPPMVTMGANRTSTHDDIESTEFADVRPDDSQNRLSSHFRRGAVREYPARQRRKNAELLGASLRQPF
jgi:hypothetical protein